MTYQKTVLWIYLHVGAGGVGSGPEGVRLISDGPTEQTLSNFAHHDQKLKHENLSSRLPSSCALQLPSLIGVLGKELAGVWGGRIMNYEVAIQHLPH